MNLWLYRRTYESEIFTANGNTTFDNIVLTFVVGRNPDFFLGKVLPLTSVLAVATSCTLLLPSEDSNRLAITVTIVLALVAFQFVLHHLPRVPVLTRLDKHFLCSYVLNALVIIETTVVESYWLAEPDTDKRKLVVQSIDYGTLVVLLCGFLASLVHLLCGHLGRPTAIATPSSQNQQSWRPIV